MTLDCLEQRKTLEAHGTGTALGDPVEVGAAVLAFGHEPILCTSLKANAGHLEAVAAGAGVVSMISMTASLGCVAPNAQFRILNPHLVSLVKSGLFLLPAHGALVVDRRPQGRVSSFGASGTIAHGAFVPINAFYAAQKSWRPLESNLRHRLLLNGRRSFPLCSVVLG